MKRGRKAPAIHDAAIRTESDRRYCVRDRHRPTTTSLNSAMPSAGMWRPRYDRSISVAAHPSPLDSVARSGAAPNVARKMFALHASKGSQTKRRSNGHDLIESHDEDDGSQRLAQMPGFGPVGVPEDGKPDQRVSG